MWKECLLLYGSPSPAKIQETEVKPRKQKWFSDGFPQEITGLEMTMSKYKKLLVFFCEAV